MLSLKCLLYYIYQAKIPQITNKAAFHIADKDTFWDLQQRNNHDSVISRPLRVESQPLHKILLSHVN